MKHPLPKQSRPPYRFLILLSILYTTIGYLSVLLIYRLVSLGSFYAPISTIIIPFWFTLADVITEVYGYSIARNLIWSLMICELLFVGVLQYSLNLPAPNFWHHQEEYRVVYDHLFRVYIGSLFAVSMGVFVNVYCISRWKTLVRGRFFGLRSLGASIIGEAVFTFFVFIIEFWHILPFKNIFELMCMSYFVKVAFLPIAVIPAAIFAAILKKLEHIDTYDVGINYNPFKFSSITKSEE